MSGPAFVGVDGCKGGWLAATILGHEINVRMFPNFRQLFTELRSPRRRDDPG